MIYLIDPTTVSSVKCKPVKPICRPNYVPLYGIDPIVA